MRKVLLIVALSAGLVPAAAGVRPAAQAGDEQAKRHFESGLSFMETGRHEQALKDFQTVIDSFPQSRWADDALLQIAHYHLDLARDYPAAQAAAERLSKEYAGSDSAAMAYVLLGRLAVVHGHGPEEVQNALDSFERVPRLFPGSPAEAAARFYAGETLRQTRRFDEALQQFRQASLEHPRSIWAARADLAAASNLVVADRATQAFGLLQRIRQRFPNSPEASAALNLNTIIHRLYLRKPAPFAFSARAFGGEKDRFRDVIGLVFDGNGRLLLGHKGGVTVFDPKGPLVRTLGSQDPSAFFVDGRERIVVVRRDVMVPEGGAPVLVAMPVAGRAPREVEEIPSVITMANGDRLIADRKAKVVLRMSPDGKSIATFVTVNAERLARSAVEDVAMIDRDSKNIVIVDREGKNPVRIPQKGVNYQFDDPADLVFDSLGHLYVLDARRAAIHVFGPRNRLLTTLTAPGREAGSLQKPRALAVDAAGRLFVFDESAQRIQVYQ